MSGNDLRVQSNLLHSRSSLAAPSQALGMSLSQVRVRVCVPPSPHTWVQNVQILHVVQPD